MSHAALRLLTVAVLSAAAVGTARADITWNITYADVDSNRGVGFDDPTEGATRQGTITAVTNYINSVIDADGEIDLLINASEMDGSGALASAGSRYAIFDGQTGFVAPLVMERANGGADPFPAVSDGFATFDFGTFNLDDNLYTWNSDLGDPTSSEFDLFSVALHELTHALGFASVINPDGSSGLEPNLYSTFDSFLRDSLGNPLIDGVGNFIADVDVLTSGAVFFETLTGQMIELYAPGTFRPGSSLSHVDFDDSLMSYAIANGEMQRTYSTDELAMLSTMGYSVQVSAVPEPSSLVLLGATFAGLGLCRLRLRKRRSCEATTTA